MRAFADDRRDRLRDLLSAWYASEARPLPWRATRDPYAVLVSEVMLQQTQAARVEPRWHAFLARFPTVFALAAAPLADVLVEWEGLGYNRRARNLQLAARAVVAEHDGVVPDDLDALRALPGIGEYTARAVLAFAFGRPVAPVDVNVTRVLARAVAGDPLGAGAGQALADQLAIAAGSAGTGGTWSHALMDLGARVCVARSPRCGDCPISTVCAWRRGGGEDPAAASAVRSRPQGRFVGSDRWHRGRLMDALRTGVVDQAELPAAAQLEDPRRLAVLVGGLVSDGLAEWEGESLRLPGFAASAASMAGRSPG